MNSSQVPPDKNFDTTTTKTCSKSINLPKRHAVYLIFFPRQKNTIFIIKVSIISAKNPYVCEGLITYVWILTYVKEYSMTLR